MKVVSGDGGTRTEALCVELQNIVIHGRCLAMTLPVDGPRLADHGSIGRGVLQLQERRDDGLP